MRILSIRQGLNADHSSSTYEFFALDQLTSEQREAVQRLTGESPRRHLRFHYWGDWSNIPSGWTDKLLTLGYDILVSESYDWWAVRLSLPHREDLFWRIGRYECERDGNGSAVRRVGERMIVYFGFSMDYGAAYDAFGEDPFEGLADLFEEIRDELLAGNMGALRVMYDLYGYEEEDEGEEAEDELSGNAWTLAGIITRH